MVFCEEKIRFQCVGSGDAFGSGGRLNSCYHLRVGPQALLLDCGCSSLIGLQRCGLAPTEISTVVVSHLHGDHFGGIPFLLLEGKYASRRQEPLTLIGPTGLQDQVEKALDAMYPGTLDDGFEFPVHYVVLSPDNDYEGPGFSIAAFPVKHGRSQQVYGLRLSAAGKAISYTGDTEWCDALVPLAQGSDLLIAECFAYDRSIPSHLDYRTLIEKAALLDCRKMVLTHLGPEMLMRRDALKFDVLNDGDILMI